LIHFLAAGKCVFGGCCGGLARRSLEVVFYAGAEWRWGLLGSPGREFAEEGPVEGTSVGGRLHLR